MPPIAAAVAATVYGADPALVTVSLLLYVALDAALFSWRELRSSEIALAMRVRAPGAEHEQDARDPDARTRGAGPGDERVRDERRRGASVAVEARSVVELVVQLDARQGRTGVLVTPITLPAAEPLGRGAACGALRAGRPATCAFRYTLLRAGRSVFPGVLVRTCSPLRLFERSLLLLERCEVPVRPGQAEAVDPRIARFLRSDLRAGGPGRASRRGTGGEFAELRPYRFPDPVRRVDWKATARTGGLVVREFEPSSDYAVSILLDASPDPTWSTALAAGFARAAQLVAQLSAVASRAGIAVRLTAYDERVLLDVAADPGARGHERLLAALAELPDRVLVGAALARAGRDRLLELAADAIGALDRRGRDAARSLAGASTEELLRLVVDLARQRIVALQASCAQCGGVVFADERRCPACGRDAGGGELPPRAACLEGLLAAALRRPGRELLVVVSSLQGGETCEPVAALLERAAAGARSVHLALPDLRLRAEWRPTHPAAIDDERLRAPILYDVERLAELNRVAAFEERLVRAGVGVHHLEDAESLDDIVARLLTDEVLRP